MAQSSLINSLKKSTVVKAGGTPGVTTHMQEVILDAKVRLLDSPGVVFSGSSADPSNVLRNAVRIDAIKDPVKVLEELSGKLGVRKLRSHFSLPDKDDDDNSVRFLLMQLSITRGFLKRGGVPDLTRACEAVLQEIACGKFPYHTMPPSRKEENAIADGDVQKRVVFHSENTGMEMSTAADLNPMQMKIDSDTDDL